MKKGYQNALKAGALHCLWSGMILGALVADVHSRTLVWSWGISVSWSIIRGLGIATLFSVMLGMLAAYRDEDIFGWKAMGVMIVLPLFAVLVLSHAGWLIYSLVLWQWHYDDLRDFLSYFVRFVVWLEWGTWSFVFIPVGIRISGEDS
ncbi:hypothetical protein P9911_003790 [Klebsiella oxytoca]|uniref:hypothetical protein n=1 Tax=Klebsiella oxytoca TaxID=571 RepID=UPI00254C2B6D|nr:hypothetical protein [Klebsiella oxytoca]MEC5504971.1 hypothetical protein [Klebsiella oxytoca]